MIEASKNTFRIKLVLGNEEVRSISKMFFTLQQGVFLLVPPKKVWNWSHQSRYILSGLTGSDLDFNFFQ